MLELDNIHVYWGESHVLQGVSLMVEPGEVVCLLGRNGVGKTTTLKAVMGINPPKKGRVVFQGQDAAGSPPYLMWRKSMGYVPEDRRIFSELTVEENLEIARAPNRSDPQWPLEKIYDVFSILKDLKNKPGGALSGGEQQMLAIARALVGEPRFLLLDEPNEGLAPILVREIGLLIDEIKKFTTILLTEQNLTFALKHSQRAYILEKGRIRYQGTARELAADQETQNRYLTV